MAFAIGKVAILVGAGSPGLVGSVLAKEGRMPKVSDVFSGAYKVFFKLNRHGNTKSSSSKSHNDSLLAQVSSLRQELQLLASNRPITIVPGHMVLLLSLLYLDTVMFGGSKPNGIYLPEWTLWDSSLDEISEVTTATQGEISELRKEVDERVLSVQSINRSVRTLQTRLNTLAVEQDWVNAGMLRLLDFSQESFRTTERIEAATPSSSQPALEMPPVTPSRSESLPSLPSREPASLSASSLSFMRTLRNAAAATGLMDIFGISEQSEQLISRHVRWGPHRRSCE